MSNQRKYLYNSLLLILILVITFLLVYSPHLNYGFPLHVDEWHHVAKAIQIIEAQEMLDINPYFDTPHTDTEPGFHVLLAEIFLMTGLDPILHFKFLPGLFASISSVALFSLVYRKTGATLTGLLAMMFFATLRSNVNIMGLWFFVPFTASISLTYLFFLAFMSGIEANDKGLILTGMMILSASFLIHPITAAFMVFITGIYSVMNSRKILKNLSAIIYLSIVPIIGLLVFIGRLRKQWGSHLSGVLIDHLIYEHGWGKVEMAYSLPNFYGLLALALAIVGLAIAIKRGQWLIVIWPITTAIIIYAYSILEFTIVAPYQRMLYYSIAGMVIVSAIGLRYVMIKLMEVSRRICPRQISKELYSSAMVFLLICMVFFAGIRGYYELPPKAKLYHFLDTDDYNTIKWFQDNYGEDNLVLASSWLSIAVYPLSKNRVIGIVPAQLEGGNKKIVNRFFNGDCNEKKDIIEEIRPDFVMARARIDCDFLKEIYMEGDYIYRPLG